MSTRDAEEALKSKLKIARRMLRDANVSRRAAVLRELDAKTQYQNADAAVGYLEEKLTALRAERDALRADLDNRGREFASLLGDVLTRLEGVIGDPLRFEPDEQPGGRIVHAVQVAEARYAETQARAVALRCALEDLVAWVKSEAIPKDPGQAAWAKVNAALSATADRDYTERARAVVAVVEAARALRERCRCGCTARLALVDALARLDAEPGKETP